MEQFPINKYAVWCDICIPNICTLQIKLGQSVRFYTSRLVSFETSSRRAHSEFLKLDEQRMLIFYFALISYPLPPLLPIPSPSSTSPRRHTRLVGSSLQLFVQAGALLWARSRAFLGVNFNESGTTFAYQRRFICIQGVSKPLHFLLYCPNNLTLIFINRNFKLSVIIEYNRQLRSKNLSWINATNF